MVSPSPTVLIVLGATNSQVFEGFSSTNSLEKEMETHSSIVAWEIPWQRSLVGYSPRGCKS